MNAFSIEDISDKGRKEGKLFRYEVGIYHTAMENELPDIVAKFKKYGDARYFAEFIAKGNAYWTSRVIIRS